MNLWQISDSQDKSPFLSGLHTILDANYEFNRDSFAKLSYPLNAIVYWLLFTRSAKAIYLLSSPYWCC